MLNKFENNRLTESELSKLVSAAFDLGWADAIVGNRLMSTKRIAGIIIPSDKVARSPQLAKLRQCYVIGYDLCVLEKGVS